MRAIPFRILLVEDSPADVMLVRESLAEYGIPADLRVVTDGEAGIKVVEELEAAEAPCPDLVILDLNLPKRSGYEVLERIRASVKCGRVPVIVLSSSDAAADKARAVALGCSRYLPKPPLLDDFIRMGAVVKEILSGSK